MANDPDDTTKGPDKAESTPEKVDPVTQEQAEKYAQLKEQAEQMGFDTPEAYQVYLEPLAYKALENDKKADDAPTVKSVGTPAEKVADPPDPRMDELIQNSQAARRDSFAALMTSQWGEHVRQQKDLPEEEQSSFTQKELINVLKSPKGEMIRSLSADFGGNMFAAANYALGMEKGIPTARKEGAEAEAALNRAKETAKLDRGAAVPAQTDDDQMEAYAEMVAPSSDAPVVNE